MGAAPIASQPAVRTFLRSLRRLSGPLARPRYFPMGVARYMKTYGLTEEQLASVAVAQRKWAAMNPRAMYHDPITIEDVLNSRLISWPVHILECCLVTDGGGALVLTSAERARSMGTPKKPVYILGTGESCETPIVSQMADFTSSAAFRVAGGTALKNAGIEHKDVDHIMIYDAFAHLPIYGLEDLGFVKRGEAGAFIADGRTAPGGESPTEYERWRPLLHAHRHVWDVRDSGVRSPGAR